MQNDKKADAFDCNGLCVWCPGEDSNLHDFTR